jgi:hypothetical protein
VHPSRPAYRRLVQASAWYDLVVTAGFVTPWTYALLHRALAALSAVLGAGALPPLDPFQTLYANLMGSVVVVWALLRLLRTRPVLGLYDGAARVLFAAWEGYAVLHGATRLLWLFLAAEAVFGVLQLVPWLRRRPGLAAQAPTRV